MGGHDHTEQSMEGHAHTEQHIFALHGIYHPYRADHDIVLIYHVFTKYI